MSPAADQFDVRGRTIIITGGAGLLGREYARSLGRVGARVVVADLDAPRVSAIAADVEKSGGSALGVAVDVTDESSVTAMVQATLARFGRIDGLVNNAAMDPKLDRGSRAVLASTFEDYPLALWQQSLDVNLTGVFLCTRAVAPTMRAQQRGVVVNVASTYGMVGPDQRLYEPDEPGTVRPIKPAGYSVTKAGVIGFTRYLAAYWAGTGLRVNTLTPGGVYHDQPEAFVTRYAARTPLGRMAVRDEYNGALRFLLSDASSYMTGANLVVDGGWTAW